MNDIDGEFADAPVPDVRLKRRLSQIAKQVMSEPSASFPGIARSDGELEAIYRFLNNPRVTLTQIIAPHLEATFKRAEAAKRVVVAHDSTQFSFPKDVGDELGYLPTTHQQGFCGHFALVMNEAGQALGIGGVKPYFFEQHRRGVRKGTWRDRDYYSEPETAYSRWGELVDEVHGRMGPGVEAVHVMDREGDSYRLMGKMVADGDRFVVRIKRVNDRPAVASLDDDESWETLEEVLEETTYVCERQVELARRKPRALANGHPARRGRTATLALNTTTLVLRRPRNDRLRNQSLPPTIQLNLVRVHELRAPAGEAAVEWLLATTEPITTQAQVERVVDIYRHRWRIEEYFKALKTGCAYEQRQLETREGLLKTLGLLVPIAWQLLVTRDLSRTAPDLPATTTLSKLQLHLLRQMTRRKLSKRPTLAEAAMAIAAEGGHLIRNGPPGWQTLGRGLEKLWWTEYGYTLAQKQR